MAQDDHLLPDRLPHRILPPRQLSTSPLDEKDLELTKTAKKGGVQLHAAGAFLVMVLAVLGLISTIFLGIAVAQALAFPGVHSPATVDWPWWFLSPLVLVLLNKEMREYADKFLQRMFR